MILTLYDKDHNKLRPLTQLKDMHIDSVLTTGDKTLSFIMPGSQLADVCLEGYVSTSDDEYVIKSIIPASGGWYQIQCNLNVEDLESYMESFESVEKTMQECLDYAFVGTGWHVGVCEVKKRRTIRRTNTTPWKIMQDARKTYRAEIKINSKAKTVDIYERIGEDKGAYFAEQLNLRQFNRQATSYDFYTQIKPIGADGLTIESVNGGDPILSNHTYCSKNKLYVWVDQRYTVADNLKADAEAKLAEMASPLMTYGLDIIDLAKISDEYKDILDYNLGDTITLIHGSTDTHEKTRIVSTAEYPNEPNRNSCEVANSILKFEDLQQELQDAADTVNNITTNNGTLDGSKVDSITTNQISDFSAAVGKIADLTALRANIAELYATRATIQQLNAVTARIGTLEATTITTTVFSAELAKINQAIISKADITDLTAATGKITILESSVATLDTIVNRVTTSDSIHSLLINASTAVIDDGYFKSIVSKLITVNDLLAGDISTTRFRVKSDSGHLVISDNTIQIRDANRERVQIGKDASSDYSLSLWDASGALIWDARGLKAAGIKDAIIRNDMVAANANIDGKKINIASVVTEINSGTTTINANHILYDGKSLDVAFSTMQTSVSTVTKTVIDNKSKWDTASTNASNALSKATSVETRANSGEFDGKGVKTTAVTYQAAASGTTAPTGTWTTAIPTVNPGQYLWTRTIITYTDNTTTTAYSVAKMAINGTNGGKGDKGDTGATGNGISSIASYYLASASASGVTTATAGWTTTPQAVNTSKKYHWSYQIISYTNGSKTTTTPAIIGVYGDTGAKGATGASGKGINAVVPQYYLSTSNTAQSGGSWKTTQDTWSTGKYYWTRDAITWSDGSTTYTTPALATGLNNANANAQNAITQVTTVTETVKSHSTQITAQEGKIATLITDTTQVKKDVTAVQGDVTTAKGNITTLQTNYSSLQQTVGGLSSKVGEHTSSIATVTTTVNNNKANWDKAPTALSTANAAKTLADSKSKVFNAQPTTPYKVGDLWVQGSGGNIMRCKVARASGSYAASDWEKADKYTDDTKANAVDTRITTEVKKVTDKQSSFEQSLTAITGRVSSTESTVSTVKSTIDTNKANWDKAPTALSAANTAKSTADTATTTANTAKTTADSAKSVATTATTTANTAKSTADSAKSTATTANNTANSAILATKVTPISGSAKLFKNVAGYSNDTANVKGAFVIVTPILPSKMCRFRITGYNYVSGTNSNIDITVTGYNYDGSIVNCSYTNAGSVLFSSVKLAKVSATDKRLVIILGGVTDTWQYPKISVETALISYSSTPPDSYKDGWSVSLVTTLSTAYVHTVSVPGMNVQSEITSVKTKESNLELTVDQFKTTVSSTYATKTQLTAVDGKFASYATTVALNSAIQASANSIINTVSKTYATQSSLSGLTTRVTAAESKLTATSLTTTISSGLQGSNSITTTKFVMDKNGLHIKGGGLDIVNNAGLNVLSADANGNLAMTGMINATTGKIGGWNIDKTILGSTFVANVADGNRTGIAPGINTQTLAYQPKDGLCFWAGAYYSSTTSDYGHVAISNAAFRVYADGRLYAANATMTGAFTSTGVENTKVVVGNGRADLFISGNHCGGLAAAYTSSTSRGIFLSADTSAKFISIGQTDINGKGGASWYTMNFGLNPGGWTERHIFSGSSNFLVQPRYGAGFVLVSNIEDAGGLRSIRHIYHGNPESGNDYLQYEDVNGDDYYVKTTWVSDIKLKHDITTAAINGREAIRRFEHRSFTFNKNGQHRSIGYIAQNLQAIDPQLVDNLGGTLAINSDVVIPYISKAVQELDLEVLTIKQQRLRDRQIDDQQHKRDIAEIKQHYAQEMLKLKYEYEQKLAQLQNRVKQLESRLI